MPKLARYKNNGDAPEAETKYDAWAYLLIGLLGIPLIALAVGALVMPPGIAFALVRRGLQESRPTWVVLGASTGLVWLLLLAATGRKIMRGRNETPARQTEPQP